MCLQKKISLIGKEVEAGWLDQNRFVNLINTDTPRCNIFLFLPKEQGSWSREDELCPLLVQQGLALALQERASDWQGRGGGRVVSGGIE